MRCATLDTKASPCPICKGTESVKVAEGQDYEYHVKPGLFTVVRCITCSHVSIFPMPAREEVLKLYPDTYYTLNPRSPLYLKGFIYEQKIKRDVQRILKLVKSYDVHSIVDVGCGDAARLFRLSQTLDGKMDYVGLDLKFDADVKTQALRSGVKLVECNVEFGFPELRNNGHDLIIMSQLIEHVTDPVGLLHALRSKLSAKGMVLIETPDLAGFDYLIYKMKYWGGYHIPRHLNLFSQKHLCEVLMRNGFRILKKGSLPSPGFWIISLRNRFGMNSIERTSHRLEFVNFSNLPCVAFFTLIDLLVSAFGFRTSNQFVLAAKSEQA